jgi:hypothetical protein
MKKQSGVVIAALMSVSILSGVAQHASPQPADGVTIRGAVLNSVDKFIGDATVRLEQKGAQGVVETKTNAVGVYVFSALQTGSYILSAEKAGLRSRATGFHCVVPGEQKQIELVLEDSSVVHADSKASAPPSTQAMEFADKPNFTVAGVTGLDCCGGARIGFQPANERSSHARDAHAQSERFRSRCASFYPYGAAEQTNLKASCAQLLAALPATSRQTVSSANSISMWQIQGVSSAASGRIPDRSRQS